MKFFTLAATAACLFAFTTTLSADVTTYFYYGNDFTATSNNAGIVGSYTTAMSVDIQVTFSAPLPDSTSCGFTIVGGTCGPANLLSYSFQDGEQVINSTPGGAADLYFTTDANGNIVQWYDRATNPLDGVSYIYTLNNLNGDGQETDVGFDIYGSANCYCDGFVQNNPGIWTEATPEPATWAMSLIGGAALALGRRWKLRRRIPDCPCASINSLPSALRW
jgi:hypothetical protein